MQLRTSIAAVAVTAAVGAIVPAATASAAPAGRPDTACMRAGIATLQGAGLLDDVARGGLPIAKAVSLGVAPRKGTDVSALPSTLPLSVVLADHRAGARSLFQYPWC